MAKKICVLKPTIVWLPSGLDSPCKSVLGEYYSLKKCTQKSEHTQRWWCVCFCTISKYIGNGMPNKVHTFSEYTYTARRQSIKTIPWTSRKYDLHKSELYSDHDHRVAHILAAFGCLVDLYPKKVQKTFICSPSNKAQPSETTQQIADSKYSICMNIISIVNTVIRYKCKMAERETKGKHTYLDFSILIGAQHRFKNPVIHNAEQPIQQL